MPPMALWSGLALLGPRPSLPQMEPQVLHRWAVPWAPAPWPQPHPRRIRVPRGYGWPLLASPEAGTLHKGRNRRPAQHPGAARHLDRRAHARLRAGASLSLGQDGGWGGRDCAGRQGGEPVRKARTGGRPGQTAIPRVPACLEVRGRLSLDPGQGRPLPGWEFLGWPRASRDMSGGPGTLGAGVKRGPWLAEGGSRSMTSTWGCPRTVPVLRYLMGPGGGAGAGLGQGVLA